MTMGERIVVLRDGKLQQVGSPTDVYEYPVNRFVAGFIGSPSMNFIDVEYTEDGTIVAESGFEYQLSAAYRSGLEVDSGRSLVMGIRPEDVHPADGTGQTVTTSVEVVEPIGSDNYLYLAVGDEFVARVDADVDPNPGDTIDVTFEERKLRLFDRRTGETIWNSEHTVSPTEAKL